MADTDAGITDAGCDVAFSSSAFRLMAVSRHYIAQGRRFIGGVQRLPQSKWMYLTRLTVRRDCAD
jgi:hypothetical protein